MRNNRDKKSKSHYPIVSDAHTNDINQHYANVVETGANTTTTPGKKPAENTHMNAVAAEIPAITIHPMVLQDGVSHINIDAHGRTELGRMLVHKYLARFEHPTFGRFNSVEGFWGFIRDGARDDRWRYLSGMAAKRETRDLGKRYVANFHQIIMEANFFKVEQNEAIRALMMASTLPFEHYYIFRSAEMAPTDPGVPTRPQIAPWLTRGFDDIRKMLLAGKRPEKPDYSDVFLAGDALAGKPKS